ncbi:MULTISPECIES: hypothetical protein [unclassified Pseudoalteromonas]|uniref:hypothetical protein n=1 Tax=unclassified Pseudoalteromonas TaxID=194690 RepID=UPI001F34F9E5|nr:MULTISPECIES: hypothetical protein [unclassified Pseudoalteromonas]MCF2827083.1 hypothetical protein [Pseudoalteromonas sp. OF5H-5]MCF2832045.1 hypothetical protein [Pseudoalteromonas sp. DL2-H6]MCF2925904.1 hypothetical protein [Pseudoalteromonas sp. DL2-H1]
MAESTTANTVTNTSAVIAITSGVSNSEFAQSLLSASFDQIIQGHFYWQLSDVITLVCTAIVITNFVIARIDKVRLKKQQQATGL